MAGDLGADETNETVLADDMDKGEGDVTREGHTFPIEVDQPGVEEVVGTASASNAEYPPNMGEQIDIQQLR